MLGIPDKKTQGILWYIVVAALTAAVFAFGAMLFGYIVRQQIIGMASQGKHDRGMIVKDFVTIFLQGIQK